jgi:hypothetical protein
MADTEFQLRIDLKILELLERVLSKDDDWEVSHDLERVKYLLQDKLNNKDYE